MQTIRIDGYNIGNRIGSGGMADVYDATEHGLGNPVAVKFIKVAFVEDGDYLERFLREARICAKLNHPNIVKVHAVLADDAQPCIVMELLHGQTLRQRMTAGAMPAMEVVTVATQILSALAYAHQRGIVHRDIKPANIFLRDDGAVKVMDFGIARATFEKRLTQTGVWMGTPEYMSPEQVGGKVDARSDLYSLGIMMYEMLTGNVPFRAQSHVGVLHKHATAPVPELPASVPKALRAVVMGSLAKDADARFASADEMLAALPMPKPKPSGTTYYEAPRPRAALPTPVAVVIWCVVAVVVAALLLTGFMAGRRAITPTPLTAATRQEAIDTVNDAVSVSCKALRNADASEVGSDYSDDALADLKNRIGLCNAYGVTLQKRLDSSHAPTVTPHFDLMRFAQTIEVTRDEVWDETYYKGRAVTTSPFNFSDNHMTKTYHLRRVAGKWKIYSISIK